MKFTLDHACYIAASHMTYQYAWGADGRYYVRSCPGFAGSVAYWSQWVLMSKIFSKRRKVYVWGLLLHDN